jgi:hypothetical protein
MRGRFGSHVASSPSAPLSGLTPHLPLGRLLPQGEKGRARQVVVGSVLSGTDPSSGPSGTFPREGEGDVSRYLPSVPAETCPLTYPLSFTQTLLPGSR